MNNKRLMIVGGTIYQIPLIKKARQMGCYVINVDGNKSSPAFKFADEAVIGSILDYDKVVDIAEKYNIDGILTDQSDIALRTVSHVGQRLNIPSLTENMLDLFTNKYLMREYLKDNGFNYPKFKLCKNINDVYQFADLVEYPFVIKPLDSRGSNGVFCINDINDIEDKFYNSMHSNVEMDCVLAEEYIDGTYYVLDGIKLKEKHYTLAIGIKTQYKENAMVTQSIYYNNSIEYDHLRKINDTLIEKTGLEFANTHVEFKIKNGKMYLIEFAARGGGGNTSSHIVPYISGVDSQEILINYALGSDVKSIEVDYSLKKHALMFFFDSKPGKIKKILGKEEVQNNKSVINFIINVSEGDIVKSINNGNCRIGQYIITGNSENEILKTKKEIDNKLKIIYY